MVAEQFYDAVGCAESLDISLGDLFDLRNLYYEDFRTAEESFFCRLEHLLSLFALGERKAESGQIVTIKTILERRTDRWVPRSKTQVSNDSVKVESNGRGKELVEKYLRGSVQSTDKVQ